MKIMQFFGFQIDVCHQAIEFDFWMATKNSYIS